MPTEIVVVEEENAAELAHWMEVLHHAHPDVVFHGVRSSAEGAKIAGNASAIFAKAHAIHADMIAAAPRLRWIQALTTGVDHLLTLNLPKDLLIHSARGVHGPQMSELTFMYMLALTRDLQRMKANQAAHRWERWSQVLLVGKTILIVGVGAISEALAARCQAFGMKVVGISDARTSTPGFNELHPRSKLVEQAGRADYVVALVPYSPATHHMISREVLAAMKPTGIFINIARGNVVDEQALIEALREKRIAGAGLDVFSTDPLPAGSPLWDLPNVIMTPRIGGMSDIYAQQLTPLVLENLGLFLAGDTAAMRNPVQL